MFKTLTIELILLIIVTSSCCGQKSIRYIDASQNEINRYLWKNTNEIWENILEERIIELVERGAEIDFNKPYGSIKPTPFLNACGMLENLKDTRHHTLPEIEAYELEAVKIVKYLAEKGANVQALNSGHQNGLHLAAMGGREKMIPVLVDLGLDINASDSTYWQTTPLLLAIHSGDLSTVKAVVQAGADINKCSAFNNTPLDFAKAYAKGNTAAYSYHQQQEIYEYLISLGAKKGKADFKGWSF